MFDTYGLSFYEDVPSGRATNLFTVNIDGSGLKQLTNNAPGGHRATQPFWRAYGTIAYIDAEAVQSLNRYLKYLSANGEPLPDPSTPIQATHPRFRPGT